jgi:hypothetical protein
VGTTTTTMAAEFGAAVKSLEMDVKFVDVLCFLSTRHLQAASVGGGLTGLVTKNRCAVTLLEAACGSLPRRSASRADSGLTLCFPKLKLLGGRALIACDERTEPAA